jgi:hypothetical protein
VPVELLRPMPARLRHEPAAKASTAPPSLPAIAEAEESWGERTSLFGDLEA